MLFGNKLQDVDEGNVRKLLDDIRIRGGLLFDQIERNNVIEAARTYSQNIHEMIGILACVKELYGGLMVNEYHYYEAAYEGPSKRGRKFELTQIRSPYLWSDGQKNSCLGHLVTTLLTYWEEYGGFRLRDELLVEPKDSGKVRTWNKLKLGLVYEPRNEKVDKMRQGSSTKYDGKIERSF